MQNRKSEAKKTWNYDENSSTLYIQADLWWEGGVVQSNGLEIFQILAHGAIWNKYPLITQWLHLEKYIMMPGCTKFATKIKRKTHVTWNNLIFILSTKHIEYSMHDTFMFWATKKLKPSIMFSYFVDTCSINGACSSGLQIQYSDSYSTECLTNLIQRSMTSPLLPFLFVSSIAQRSML